jgi:hypothetical protein
VFRIVPVGDQEQRPPGRLEVGHELASWRSEHVRVWPEKRATLQNWRHASEWVEWNAAILRILRVTTGDGDLVSLPVDVPILNPHHLAPATARLQGSDDAVVHRGTDLLVFRAAHLRGCYEQRLFLMQSDATIALGLLLCFDRHSESVERRRRQIRRILEASPVDRRPNKALQPPAPGAIMRRRG